MTIKAASIAMASSHTSERSSTVIESLRITAPRGSGGGAARSAAGDILDVSPETRSASESRARPVFLDIPGGSGSGLEIARLIIERLTGTKISVLTRAELEGGEETAAPDITGAPAGAPGAGGGGSVAYDRYERHTLTEMVTFSASGTIHTADGHKVSFAISFSLRRQEVHESLVSLRLGADNAVIDPLVVNFGGNLADLSGGPFAFDLTADGELETIPFVGPGSGFLALDLEGDGVIRDGSQLFGPRTGDGFAELAVHDLDGSGWIDSRDPIYDYLRIWSRCAGGEDLVRTLEECGIRAIYLGSMPTEFDLLPRTGDSAGARLATTGLYLRSGGMVGTIQQVDMVL